MTETHPPSPMEPPSRPAAPPPADASSLAPAGSPPRVLVVDDEQGIREMLAYELKPLGYLVQTAASGELAVEAARREPFDVMVTDLKMPGIDGLETLRRVREILPQIEVIVATGYATMETAIDCLKAGAYDYVRKPYELEEMQVTIQRALQKRGLESIVSLYEAARDFLRLRRGSDLRSRIPELARRILGGRTAALVVYADGDEIDQIVTSDPPVAPELISEALALLPRASRTHPELLATEIAGPRGRAAVLVVARQKGTTFSRDERQLAFVLASQIGLAIENVRLLEELESLVITDELTRVHSRRFVLEALRQQIHLALRTPGRHLSCLFIDIDHFKRVNDELGHAEGDNVLRRVAASIQGAARASDVVARLGGEEFLVLLPVTPREGATIVAERVREAVQRGAGAPAVTVSIGVSSLLADGAGGRESVSADFLAAELLRSGDTALYRAKAAGRNRVEVAT